jgi:hypothetical protein
VGSARLFAAFFFLSGCVPPRGDVVRLQSGADAIAEATSAGENHDWCCGQPLRGYDLPGVGELYIAIADEVRCTLAVDKPGFGILRYRSDHCSITRVDDRLCVDRVELIDDIGPLKGQPDKLVLDGCIRVDPPPPPPPEPPPSPPARICHEMTNGDARRVRAVHLGEHHPADLVAEVHGGSWQACFVGHREDGWGATFEVEYEDGSVSKSAIFASPSVIID